MGGTASLRLLLDTHIWFWVLTEPARIGRRAKAAIARAENEVWLSPISVWELLLLAERGRVKLGDEPRQWVAKALSSAPVQETPLNFDVAIRSREIMPKHPDSADRFLVATALVNDLTLVTADDVLIGARCCSVMPNR
jgi:PIN domain nuclease of toxin-antitoxin system